MAAGLKPPIGRWRHALPFGAEKNFDVDGPRSILRSIGHLPARALP